MCIKFSSKRLVERGAMLIVIKCVMCEFFLPAGLFWSHFLFCSPSWAFHVHSVPTSPRSRRRFWRGITPYICPFWINRSPVSRWPRLSKTRNGVRCMRNFPPTPDSSITRDGLSNSFGTNASSSGAKSEYSSHPTRTRKTYFLPFQLKEIRPPRSGSLPTGGGPPKRMPAHLQPLYDFRAKSAKQQGVPQKTKVFLTDPF